MWHIVPFESAGVLVCVSLEQATAARGMSVVMNRSRRVVHVDRGERRGSGEQFGDVIS